MKIIQGDARLNERFIQQLKNRKVEAGKYCGGQVIAEKWRQWSMLHPQRHVRSIPLDARVTDQFNLVDLGPGTADPSIAAVRDFRCRIQHVYCIDTSAAMGEMAAENYQRQLAMPATVIVADFLKDTEKILSVFESNTRSNIIMCLGNTVANYEQRQCFDRLRSLL